MATVREQKESVDNEPCCVVQYSCGDEARDGCSRKLKKKKRQQFRLKEVFGGHRPKAWFTTGLTSKDHQAVVQRLWPANKASLKLPYSLCSFYFPNGTRSGNSTNELRN